MSGHKWPHLIPQGPRSDFWFTIYYKEDLRGPLRHITTSLGENLQICHIGDVSLTEYDHSPFVFVSNLISSIQGNPKSSHCQILALLPWRESRTLYVAPPTTTPPPHPPPICYYGYVLPRISLVQTVTKETVSGIPISCPLQFFFSPSSTKRSCLFLWRCFILLWGNLFVCSSLPSTWVRVIRSVV